MKLLIDIGNSRLKWGQESQGNISAQTAVAHSLPNWQNQVLSAWQSLETPETVAISSVADSDILQTVVTLATQLWPQTEIVIPKSQAENFGVTNSYPQPEKLGIDRWLCLIAARYFYPQAVWIVDCGTAITVDFIDADGIHAGGLIAPGLNLMKNALLQNTANLNFNPQAYPLGLANSTDAAIFNGTLYAAVGLIEQALKAQTDSAVLILTGGDAALVYPHLQQTAILEPNLVLKGLSISSKAER